MLGDVRFHSAWRDFDRQRRHVATEVTRLSQSARRAARRHRVEIIRPVFYQVARAYVVGRIVGRDFLIPLVIALKNTDGGVLVDAVMQSEADVSIVFSFTKSYFHVDLERVGEAVLFLKSMLPRKPVSELFTVLGRAKQGKTERYRELMRHLEQTRISSCMPPASAASSWSASPCPRSMSSSRSFATSFPYPKNVLREEVKAKYQLVFKHDRAGRLVDAQEFKQLRFPQALFAPELLEELRDRDGNDCARGRRRPDFRSHVHRAAHDATQPVPAHAQPRPQRKAPRSTTDSASATSPTPTSSRATCC